MLFTIEASVWRETPAGLKAPFRQLPRLSQMLAVFKAWVEHGVNLREVFYA